MPPPTPEQHTAISQLCAAYCWHVDAGAGDELTALFTADAVFCLGEKDIEGRERVVRFLTNSTRGTHLSAAPVIDVTGDVATGHSRFLFAPTGGGSLLSGGYADDYLCENGQWRFRRRHAIIASHG